jgi:hypothetical protein
MTADPIASVALGEILLRARLAREEREPAFGAATELRCLSRGRSRRTPASPRQANRAAQKKARENRSPNEQKPEKKAN